MCDLSINFCEQYTTDYCSVIWTILSYNRTFPWKYVHEKIYFIFLDLWIFLILEKTGARAPGFILVFSIVLSTKLKLQFSKSTKTYKNPSQLSLLNTLLNAPGMFFRKLKNLGKKIRM